MDVTTGQVAMDNTADRTEEIEAAMTAARDELHSAGIWSVNDTQLRLVVCAVLRAKEAG